MPKSLLCRYMQGGFLPALSLGIIYLRYPSEAAGGVLAPYHTLFRAFCAPLGSPWLTQSNCLIPLVSARRTAGYGAWETPLCSYRGWGSATHQDKVG